MQDQDSSGLYLEKLQEAIYSKPRKCMLVAGYGLSSQTRIEDGRSDPVPSNWGEILGGIVDWWYSAKNPMRGDNEKSEQIERLINDEKYIEAVAKIDEYLDDSLLRRRCINQVLRCYKALVGEAHCSLVKLPFRGYLTTNYDTFIEAAYAMMYKKPLPKFYCSEIEDALESKVDGEPFILKLRGDIDRPDSISLNDLDLKRSLQDPNRPLKDLSRLLATSHLLFIGFDLDTPDLACLRNLWEHKMLDPSLDHWLMVPAEKETEFRTKSGKLTEYIRIIAYDAGKGMEEFLGKKVGNNVDNNKERKREIENSTSNLKLEMNEGNRQVPELKPTVSALDNAPVALSSQASEQEKQNLKLYVDFGLHISENGYLLAQMDRGDRHTDISTHMPDDIQLTLGLIEHQQTDVKLLKGLGKKLYEIIFPSPIHEQFVHAEALADEQKQKLRIHLNIKPSELAGLPWEFMYNEEKKYFLAVHPAIVLSRYLDLGLSFSWNRRREGPLQVLIVIANPSDQTPLDRNEWEGVIKDALAGPIEEKRITTYTVKTAAPENIRSDLSTRNPDIIQFVGHGIYQNGKGYLALIESEKDDKTKMVDDEHFADIMIRSDFAPSLVSLIMPESAKGDSHESFRYIAPRIVHRGVPVVVAMQYSVLISNVKIFLESFYNSLAAHEPVDCAVQQARKALADKVGLDKREFAAPVLYTRVKDGNIF